MPTRLCLEPTCPLLATYRGRCPTHSRVNEQRTHHNRRIYNSAKWKRTRERVLFEQPLCACGCGHIATDVDHIEPIETGGDPWARSNLQPLAASCHARKTNAEVRAR